MIIYNSKLKLYELNTGKEQFYSPTLQGLLDTVLNCIQLFNL